MLSRLVIHQRLFSSSLLSSVRVVSSADGGVEGHALIFSCKNSKITTPYWTTVDKGMLDPSKKKILHVQGQRRSLSKMVGGAKSCLESNPMPSRDAQRSQKKPCVHQKTLQTEPKLPLSVRVPPAEVWVSSRLLQTQGLWVQQTWLWHNPLGGGCH